MLVAREGLAREGLAATMRELPGTHSSSKPFPGELPGAHGSGKLLTYTGHGG